MHLCSGTLGLSGFNGVFVPCSLTSPVSGVEGPDGVNRVFVLHFPGRVTSSPLVRGGGVNACSQVFLAGKIRSCDSPAGCNCPNCLALLNFLVCSAPRAGESSQLLTVLHPEAHPAGALAGTGGFHRGRGGRATFLPGMLGLRRRSIGGHSGWGCPGRLWAGPGLRTGEPPRTGEPTAHRGAPAHR